MPIYKQWALASRVPSGIPTDDHFQMNEDHTPDLRKGEILCRALFLSVDPITRYDLLGSFLCQKYDFMYDNMYFRLYMEYAMNEGDVLPGRQVARVVESRNSDYSKGKVSYIE